MLHIQKFTFNPFMENTWLVWDSDGSAMVIDPGCYDLREKEQISKLIAEKGLTLEKVVNTHCHIDHVLGNKFIKDQYNVPLGLHEADIATLRSVKVYAPNYGFQHYEEAEYDFLIEEGDIINVGEETFRVLFVPGHAPGHIALYNESNGVCFSGDILFNRSIGRTDLPGGDHDLLIRGIQEKMFKLPDTTVICCGHGAETTIGEEKKFNPFCAIK